ncbi:MAG: ImmA/IrrE family metallo-endopeptidase [Thermodesulfobacteriota bacterium]
MKNITINPQRIEYMMELFDFSRNTLLESISKGLKNPIVDQEIFSAQIKESHLKKIDKIFDKGLSFYTNTAPIKKNKKGSIFFRKESFNSELSLGDREIVNKMENRMRSLSALCALSNYAQKRELNKYKVSDEPRDVAYKIRKSLYPDEYAIKDRDFLNKLIQSFASQNILVIEFVEAWNKKNKTTLDGFFIAPNAITIKRNQKSFKREIFTLAHELGHYLLDKEELDSLFSGELNTRSTSSTKNTVERWCDAFSFFFLAGKETTQRIEGIPKNLLTYENEEILQISRTKHISRLALFTYLATTNKIDWEEYSDIKKKLGKEYRIRQEEEKQKRELEKEGGNPSPARMPKPIVSPLEKSIYTSAFYEGVVEEYDLFSHFEKKTAEEIIYG